MADAGDPDEVPPIGGLRPIDAVRYLDPDEVEALALEVLARLAEDPADDGGTADRDHR